jgi:drug/metabolite transporter (DMT)-like permease
MNQRNLFLFALCSLIWGTTWLVIKFQIDSTSAIVGVFYRFAIATVLMMAINLIFIRKSLKYPLKNHGFFILHGLFNFCLNYILTYVCERYITSGMVALTFTLLIYFNMILLKIFFGKKVSRNVLGGAVLGFLGIFLLFSGEILNMSSDNKALLGIGIGIVATFCASLGNMVAYYNHTQKIPVMTFNAFGMMYGTLFSLIFGLILGENFAFPMTASFTGSLVYLSLFGTVVAFWAYQTLVGEMGADKAAYTSIFSPMLAVVVSSFYETVNISIPFFIGIAFCLMGNLLALKKEKII